MPVCTLYWNVTKYMRLACSQDFLDFVVMEYRKNEIKPK
jgi:hypothetical protein